MRACRFLFFLATAVLTALPATAWAVDVSVKVVNRLGRPVAGATVYIYCQTPLSKGAAPTVDLASLVSDNGGVAEGSYDESAIRPGSDISVMVSKAGYDVARSFGISDEYVLNRRVSHGDALRVVSLDGDAQVDELRELLAGDFEGSGSGLDGVVFWCEDRLRPALRTLALDANARVRSVAMCLLAIIGVPDDIRFIIGHAPRNPGLNKDDEWAYFVASALFEPTTDEEWAFMRRCGANEYGTAARMASVETLRLILSPESGRILKGVAQSPWGQRIDETMRYGNSEASSLSDKDLNSAIKRVQAAVQAGAWEGTGRPEFNENGDKAWVTSSLRDGRDLTFYAIIFHKVDGQWRLRGARPTRHVLLAVPQ